MSRTPREELEYALSPEGGIPLVSAVALDVYQEALKEIAALRTDIERLRRENAELAQSNDARTTGLPKPAEEKARLARLRGGTPR